MEQNVKARKNNVLLISVVALGTLLLIALVVMLLYINKASKLSLENGDLSNNIYTLNEQVQEQTAQNQKCISEIALLNDSITDVTAAGKEQLRIKNELIYTLRTGAKNVAELEVEMAELRKVETEYETLQRRYDRLLTEDLRKKDHIVELSEKCQNLQDSINKARFLLAYNINPITKWNRWLCADRYNVSVAKRVDETYITFEIAGTPFTKQGKRIVHMRMLDPSGNIINPLGEEFKYTGIQEVDYTGGYLPIYFFVEHQQKLVPGTYLIQVFIDQEKVRDTEIVLE
ncbi:MAG: hypothetical protein WCR71_05330 [Bacteroidales bacterium]|jgi:myosin heavy subunit